MEASTLTNSTTDERPRTVDHTETVTTVADLKAVLRYWSHKFPETKTYEAYVQSGLDFGEGFYVELPKSTIIRMVEAAIENANQHWRSRPLSVNIKITTTQFRNYARNPVEEYRQPDRIHIKWSTRNDDDDE